MSTFQVYILEADKDFYEGPCESLVVPTMTGQLGVLAHHSNMIAAIVPGLLTYKVPGEEMKEAAVSAGLIKIENNEVLVLVESAELPEEIDENRAKREADEAKEAILQKRSILEYRVAQGRLTRTINRLKIKNLYG
ncbi:MAG: ATP synthase F1 subunit epsilon [Clostridia bacterium]|nr:ATP synthase F1 subunit epsilon [Clostridia bacterium]